MGIFEDVFARTERERKLQSAPTHALDEILLDDMARQVSTPERKKLADKGHAMSDGSFPIATVQDLLNAIRAIGRAPEGKRAAVKAHIKRRAKALGAENRLPDDWK